jgi:hypothetical protein
VRRATAARPARNTLPWPFLAGVFLWMGAHMGATSMWPNFMATLGYSKSAISGLWGLAAFTEAPAMLAVGRLSDASARLSCGRRAGHGWCSSATSRWRRACRLLGYNCCPAAFDHVYDRGGTGSQGARHQQRVFNATGGARQLSS